LSILLIYLLRCKQDGRTNECVLSGRYIGSLWKHKATTLSPQTIADNPSPDPSISLSRFTGEGLRGEGFTALDKLMNNFYIAKQILDDDTQG
jgi:hypothetical protein